MVSPQDHEGERSEPFADQATGDRDTRPLMLHNNQPHVPTSKDIQENIEAINPGLSGISLGC